VSNGALQNIAFPSGATGVLIVPPDGSTTANIVLTSLAFGWANNIAPINPLAESDFTFDPNFLPTVIQANASPSNLPIQLLFY
jgi:hypothetical protein